MKIIACYDNFGESIDRYTVYFGEADDRKGNLACLGMSEFPDHPQGVSMFSGGVPGGHNGTKVWFSSLPANIRVHVWNRFAPEPGEPREILLDEKNRVVQPTGKDLEDDKRFHRDNGLYYAIGGLS